MASVGLDRIGRYGRTPSSGMPWRARPCSRVRARSGLASRSTLLTMAPATCTPSRSNSAALSTISSMGRPTPPSDTMTAGAPRRRATTAFESPMTAPTPACPVPSMRSVSCSTANDAWAAPDPRRQVLDDPAVDVALGEAARDVDGAHPLERLGQAEDRLHQDGVLVGRDAILEHGPLADRLDEPGRQAASAEAVHDPDADRGLAAVLAGRGEV